MCLPNIIVIAVWLSPEANQDEQYHVVIVTIAYLDRSAVLLLLLVNFSCHALSFMVDDKAWLKLCLCCCVWFCTSYFVLYKIFVPFNLATRSDAVRWLCLKFQHLAVTPAGFESARFYKWMRGRCVVTALRSLGRISVTLWQLANLRLLSSLGTYSIQPRSVRTLLDLISNHQLFWLLPFA